MPRDILLQREDCNGQLVEVGKIYIPEGNRRIGTRLLEYDADDTSKQVKCHSINFEVVCPPTLSDLKFSVVVKWRKDGVETDFVAGTENIEYGEEMGVTAFRYL